MELRDLIVTPIVIFLVYVVAYLIRPYCTDEINRRYFFPALTVRIFGALAVGFIYQFYYSGGDTFNFHTHGSRHVWEAFWEDPEDGWRLLKRDQDMSGLYSHISKMFFYTDPSSYTIVMIASVFDLFTFSSYSATAVLFAVISMIGSWLLFRTFYEVYPHLHKPLAFATLFIPSVVFWGSGLLKDTITLSAVSMAVFAAKRIFIDRQVRLLTVLLLALSLVLLFVIKIYILLVLLPALIIWVGFSLLGKVRSMVGRAVLFTPIILVTTVGSYYAVVKAGEDNPRYSINSIARTTQITAYDIRYFTGKDAGSGYSLGELDGTWNSMVRLAPQAINVSLFRPYLWEVKNPLMLMSAIEAVFLLLFTCYVIVRVGRSLFEAVAKPDALFCLIFSVAFAFAVGISTYNFGTLNRYKIPLLPFFGILLILLNDYSNREKNVGRLASTE